MVPGEVTPEGKGTPERWFVLALGAAIAMTGVQMDNLRMVWIGLGTCGVTAGMPSLRSWLRSWFDRLR